MGVIGASQNSYTVDLSTVLRAVSAGAITASGAEAVILDFGATSPQGVEQVAYTPAHLVIDVSAVTGPGASPEAYDIVLQLSDNASGAGTGFTAGDLVVPKAVVHLGAALGADADQTYTTGRIVVGVDNEHQGTPFRFVRLANVVAGTSPSIDYSAFLARV